MDPLPLGTRAWSCQEWLLSKRLVHFTKYEVRWECHYLAATEVYPTGLDEEDVDAGYFDTPTKNTIASIRDPAESRQALWERTRAECSSEGLTKASDKLVAFSGIARMVFKALKYSDDEYLDEMWKLDLLSELPWERDGDQQASYDPDLYIAPSWSWASLNGAFWSASTARYIEYGDTRMEVQWDIQVLDVQVTPVGDVFGPVSAGSLVLQACLCQMEICTPKERSSNTTEAAYGWRVSDISGVAVF